MATPRKDRTGQVFGQWTVIADTGKTKGGSSVYLVQCSCGNTRDIQVKRLTSGRSKSCGCYRTHWPDCPRKHGKAGTATWKSWQGMLNRCRNANMKCYPKYGGRGIEVCERWHVFENFLADMGERPNGMTLDRIDGNGNYEPNNCRWATYSQQNRNKRDSVWIFFNGDIRTLDEISSITGVPRSTIDTRMRRRFNIHEAVSMPTPMPGNLVSYAEYI
jgi:hypothetical protein